MCEARARADGLSTDQGLGLQNELLQPLKAALTIRAPSIAGSAISVCRDAEIKRL